MNSLKSAQSYEQQHIHLHLGKRVKAIDAKNQKIILESDSALPYDKLVLATGAQAFIPSIPGVDTADPLFTLRTANDAKRIRKTLQQLKHKRVLIIGGGYIGLEAAASLKNLGAEVTVLEREKHILARVTAPALSEYFHQLHQKNGVQILTNKNVIRIQQMGSTCEILCADKSVHKANMIIIGVGIRVNTELAKSAGLEIEQGIKVNAQTRSSAENIFAIGDCTYHHNPHYDRMLRLESVQNAVDQAKIAAAAICGKDAIYDSIPWFWSDQYDVKLQMVGLSAGYNDLVIRKEHDKENCFSAWYFKDDELLAVDAINNARAYMSGTKLIKTRQCIDKHKLADPAVQLNPKIIIKET